MNLHSFMKLKDFPSSILSLQIKLTCPVNEKPLDLYLHKIHLYCEHRI